MAKLSKKLKNELVRACALTLINQPSYITTTDYRVAIMELLTLIDCDKFDTESRLNIEADFWLDLKREAFDLEIELRKEADKKEAN